jgi:hypothetical protein
LRRDWDTCWGATEIFRQCAPFATASASRRGARNVECEPSFGIGILPNKKIGQRLARFRQINMDNAVSHHDALEFPDGQVTLLTRLCEGQCATVLQLPITAHPASAEESVRREVREPSLLA